MKPGDLIQQTAHYHWRWYINSEDEPIMTFDKQLATVVEVEKLPVVVGTEESENCILAVTVLIDSTVLRSTAQWPTWRRAWNVISSLGSETVNEAR